MNYARGEGAVDIKTDIETDNKTDNKTTSDARLKLWAAGQKPHYRFAR